MRDAGYTLIELLVVLTLISMISLAIGSGVHFGARVWEATETGVLTANRVTSTQSLVRNLLSSAVPVAQGEYVRFEGDPSHVTFEAPSPRAMRAGRLVHVEISTVMKDSQVLLRIAFRSDDGSRLREVILPTGASTLRLSYLDASESEPAWLDRWRDRGRMPDAVRIEGRDADSRDAWPEFTARLAIAQKPDCAFDPVSLVCRSL